MDEQLKANITSSELWLRLVYMVFFGVCLQLTRIMMWAIVVLQFIFTLISGRDNTNLRGFGLSLSNYIFQVFKYLTYNTEEKPFPFSDWPSVEANPLEAGPLEGDVDVASESEAGKA